MNFASLVAQIDSLQLRDANPGHVGPIRPYFRVVSRFDMAPLQGAWWGWLFPGLKPWAEFCSPFGASP